MPLRTLIVDDEPVARQVLREELQSIPNVEIVGEADNGVAALASILQNRPDLVLLDLQMPLMSGFEVIRNLPAGSHMPAIVIVTAYDSYAIQAFDAGAIDYLLKPVGQDRLAHAVERVRRISREEAAEKLAQLQQIAFEPSGSQFPRKIVGRAGQEYFVLSASEIFAFQAEGDIVWILAANRRYMATQTLKALQQRLRNARFRRIHRKTIVNLDHIQKITALSSQRWLITLSNDQEFVASKRQARAVRELLKW